MSIRLFKIILLALCLAPGTWLRSPLQAEYDVEITRHSVSGASEPLQNGWQRLGIWEYRSTGLRFGGFSALLVLDDNRLRAFSDRGVAWTFTEPDAPPTSPASRASDRMSGELRPQSVAAQYEMDLWDIESATTDPATGEIWLGFESTHAIHKFTSEGEAADVRLLEEEVDWSGNSGAEAMVRLRDGRFLVIPEDGGEALIYPDDPVNGAAASTIDYVSPEQGFRVTEAVQLPDGRLLLILRDVVLGVPPFATRLAFADLPAEGETGALRPEVTLDIERLAPPDNYEGLAYRARADGALDVWVISDDNQSVIQRTLLVKLRFDPAKAAAFRAKQKARE
ncbi:MAG: esterase-like activity of phytase family protein [Pseudomonadota bacterium]